MISDEEIERGFCEESERFNSPISAYIAGARFASRLERIKTLEEVKTYLHPQANKALVGTINRLIEQAKSE